MPNFITPWRTIDCPYCFESFHPGEARYRPHKGPLGADPRVQAFLETEHVPELVSVRDLPGGPLMRMAHKWCTFGAHFRRGDHVCPHCHLPLPMGHALGEHKMETIALVGAANSGKSNYIAMLMGRVLQEHQKRGFHIHPLRAFTTRGGGEDHTEDSSVLLRNRYGTLFDANAPRAIERTKNAIGNVEARLPLIYELVFRWRWPWSSPRVVQLVLFDAAGEDLQRGDVAMKRLFPYLSKAKGILFLLDPWEFPGVKRALSDQGIEVSSPAHAQNPLPIATSVGQILRRTVGNTKPTRVPMAFVITKSDSLDTIVDPAARWTRHWNHDNGFDDEDSLLVSEDLGRRVGEWAPKGDLQSILHQFRRHRFFAVSALGQSPKDDLTLQHTPRPRRVADPLLWLFHEMGYLT